MSWFNYKIKKLRDRAEVARKAHNLEVVSSNLAPATTRSVTNTSEHNRIEKL